MDRNSAAEPGTPGWAPPSGNFDALRTEVLQAPDVILNDRFRQSEDDRSRGREDDRSREADRSRGVGAGWNDHGWNDHGWNNYPRWNDHGWNNYQYWNSMPPSTAVAEPGAEPPPATAVADQVPRAPWPVGKALPHPYVPAICISSGSAPIDMTPMGPWVCPVIPPSTGQVDWEPNGVPTGLVVCDDDTQAHSLTPVIAIHDIDYFRNFRGFHGTWQRHNVALKWFREMSERLGHTWVDFVNGRDYEVPEIVRSGGEHYTWNMRTLRQWDWREMVAQLSADDMETVVCGSTRRSRGIIIAP
jgi:hypothetical protein